jgi:glutaredoxin
MKKAILTGLISLSLFLPSLIFAQDKIEVNFFYKEGCPFCAEEEKLLDRLESEYSELKVNRYESVYSSENQELLKSLYEKYDVPRTVRAFVPVTFTPDKYFVGFNDNIAAEIENCLVECIRPDKEHVSLSDVSVMDREINIPFLGPIKLSSFSFPVMAMILGALDGFNVCSLGALILILSLVLSLRSKKKIFFFGGAFLLTTALSYGFLIIFWYKLFEFLSAYLKFIEVFIGLLGVGGGIYFLKQFLDLRKRGPVCESGTGSKVASKFVSKIQKLLKMESATGFVLVLLAIFAFAFLITVVEFPCSAVVPVAFAALLTKAGLAGFQYLLYISIYIVFYLLDEIVVFLIALFTSKIWLSSPKFTKWIILAEAAILFSLGIYYLFGIFGQIV